MQASCQISEATPYAEQSSRLLELPEDCGQDLAFRVTANQLRHNFSSRSASLSVRHRDDVKAERFRLDEAAKVVFQGNPPSQAHPVAAASLRRTFPSVPPARLREAADVLVDAMSGPGRQSSLERLDGAAIEIADIFTSK